MAKMDEDRFVTVQVTEITRRTSSIDGNPRWRFHTANGWFDTQPNAMCAYEVAGSEHRLMAQPLKLWLTGRDHIWKFEKVDNTRDADRPHDHEPDGEHDSGSGPCAECGQSPSAQIHH